MRDQPARQKRETSVTTDDPDRLRRVPEAVGRSLLLTAVWTGATAAVIGAAIGICVCVVSWLPNAGVSGHPLSAIRAGVLAFLAGQHGGVRLDGTPVALTPLGITLICGVLAWRASTALGESAARLGRTSSAALVVAWLLQTAGYAGACLVLAGFGRLGSTSARPVPVAAGAALLFALVAGAGLCRVGALRLRVLALPDAVIGGARAAAGAALAYVGAGAMLVAASLAVHAGAVMHLSRLVGGGVAGEPIALIGVFTAPNAAIAGAAYLAGPGFTLGSGTHVSAFTVSHGVLPAFPPLGAVPTTNGPHQAILIAMAATAVLAGCVVARACAVGSFSSALRRLAAAFAATVVLMGALGWLAGGGVGDGRLHVVGPSPWQLGVAVAIESGVVAAVLLAAWGLCRLLLGRGETEDETLATRDDTVVAQLLEARSR